MLHRHAGGRKGCGIDAVVEATSGADEERGGVMVEDAESELLQGWVPRGGAIGVRWGSGESVGRVWGVVGGSTTCSLA